MEKKIESDEKRKKERTDDGGEKGEGKEIRRSKGSTRREQGKERDKGIERRE